jgi:ABC-type sugar transport system permease subunit
LPCFALIGVWSFMGLAFIFCSAGLQSIDSTVLEAASCDGAGWWSTLFRVTLPMLSPTLFAALSIGTIGAMFSFGTINLLVGAAAPSVNSNVLAFQIYNALIGSHNYGLAACLSIALFAITLAITGVMFRFLERKVSYAR